MEKNTRKAGRPEVPVPLRKKNRAVSLTNAEYATLAQLAEAAGLGVSRYLVKSLNLS